MVREVENPSAPAADRVANDLSHGIDVSRSGRLVPGSPITHHVRADRPVGDLGTDVHRPLASAESVEILGERLPLPIDPLREGGTGNVLHTFHESDEPFASFGSDRREADAAIAHDHGGDAVQRRGCEQVVPGGLAVIVGVDVDPSRRHQESGGIEVRAPGVREIGTRSQRCGRPRWRRLLARAAPRSRRRSSRSGSTDQSRAAPWSSPSAQDSRLGSGPSRTAH